MICLSEDCGVTATHTLNWPGRGLLAYCHAHAQKGSGVLEALGCSGEIRKGTEAKLTAVNGVRTKFRTEGDFCTAALYLNGILEVDLGRLNMTLLDGPQDPVVLRWREMIAELVNRRVGVILGLEGKVSSKSLPPNYSGEAIS